MSDEPTAEEIKAVEAEVAELPEGEVSTEVVTETEPTPAQ